MRNKTKKNIINITGITIMALFFIGFGYLVLINDPTVLSKIPTEHPNTEMELVTHEKTGQKEWRYHVTDGVGNVNP